MITLGRMIEILKGIKQDSPVSMYFADPHSNRGSYDRLGIELHTSKYEDRFYVSDIVNFLTDQIGKVYGGWKGGEFMMHDDTIVCISSWGDSGNPITEEFMHAFVNHIRTDYNGEVNE